MYRARYSQIHQEVQATSKPIWAYLAFPGAVSTASNLHCLIPGFHQRPCPAVPTCNTNRILKHPDITSKCELTDLCEVEDVETGVVLRSTFTFVDVHDVVWFGQVSSVRKYDLTVKHLRQNLCRVLDDTVYPKVTPALTTLDEIDLENYIKRPNLLCLDNPEETQLLPRMLDEEARVLETLKSFPHGKLVRYHGCISRRDRIVAIALEKHDKISQYRFEDDPQQLNISACINGIRESLRHLQSLGFAHNDLNPMNIALDKDDQPVILDFGSYRKFGESLFSGGTPGWIDEDYSTSAMRHGESALKKLELWLMQNESERATLAHTTSEKHVS